MGESPRSISQVFRRPAARITRRIEISVEHEFCSVEIERRAGAGPECCPHCGRPLRAELEERAQQTISNGEEQ